MPKKRLSSLRDCHLKEIPRLALTPGEPAGIGPDLCIQIAQQKLPAEVIVIGSPELLLARAKCLDLPLTLYPFDPYTPAKKNGDGRLAIFPVELNTHSIPGELKVENCDYVIRTLTQGFELCIQNQCQALVTGPVHKAIMNQSGRDFKGHTEFLGQLANVKEVLMTFYSKELIVGLVTTHCSLKEVSSLLTADRLKHAIEILHDALQHLFKKSHPKISICGLNPHAGENGVLGDEEQIIMQPVIHALRKKGINIDDPIPADTAFTAKNRQSADAILAMYHDQGLAPIKALYFNEIVNITLGLPFIRTSVDHGTALSLAGTGEADPSSLQQAIQVAAHLCGLKHA